MALYQKIFVVRSNIHVASFHKFMKWAEFWGLYHYYAKPVVIVSRSLAL